MCLAGGLRTHTPLSLRYRRWNLHLFDYYPYPLTLWKLRKDASDFDISTKAAIKMKLRYAVKAVELWEEAFEPMAWRWIDIIISLRQMEAALKRPKRETITDEMLAQARDVDVASLIEFNRGVAKAFCHEDNRPSLVHMKRINKAWCPVCDKYFDAISVLRERDGMQFRDAVKELAR